MKSLTLLRMSVIWLSPPSRGAWIEMLLKWLVVVITRVAPLAGGVD